MIGLGSNRLSVCRRGGMSVTQAGRGGMEWLAGGRVPSWASPYSDLATAYLQQHYSAYWSEIADYGKRNPTMVPYINEDPDLVCSLMNVGKVRWLVGSGTQYIDTGVSCNTESYIKVIFSLTGTIATSNQDYFGGSGGDNRNAIRLRYLNNSNPGYVEIVYRGNYASATLAINTKQIAEWKSDGAYINETWKINRGSSPGNGNMFVFAFQVDNGNPYRISSVRFSEVYIEGEKQLVPFVSQTQGAGMLDIHDLEHPVFHENKGSGTFGTEISESPS